MEVPLTPSPRDRSVVLLACAFALSLLAGAYHVATEQHDMSARSGRAVRVAATISALPCHAPAHRAHPSGDHDCVLDAESSQYGHEDDYRDGDAVALGDELDDLILPVLDETLVERAPVFDDHVPDRLRGPTERSRAPPLS
ncbi:MAG: hypothetical protein ACAI25_04260 [Planctomycetota bacterium]